MAPNANEKELSTWGFTKGLRTGLITFIMALQIMAIIYLYIDKDKAERDKYEEQARLYEKVIEYIKPAKDHMNDVANKVDTAANRVISSSDKVDSLTSELKRKTIK